MLGSGVQYSGQKEQCMQRPGGETELRAFFTHTRVMFLRSELEFISAHSRATIHFDDDDYFKEENFASGGG